MEIVESRSALLSNYEVLTVLKQQHSAREEENTNGGRKNKKIAENVKTVEFETLNYLNNTPSSTQTDEQVVQLTTALGAWSLTKAEKLQMINIRPRQIVEIHMLIEECDERFDMEALETMLATVRQHLPRDDDNEEEEEEEDGENTDNNMAEDANGDSHNDDVAMNDV